MPPCLTLSNIWYVSRVKWSNPGKGVASFPTPQCSSYWKRSLLVALDYGCQLYASSIYPIFPLRMEWNACEKLTNKSVATDCQNLKSWESIFPKAVLIFPKNFLNFRSNKSEKPTIVNLYSYSRICLIHCDSEVAFLRAEKDAAFRPFLSFSFYLVIYGVIYIYQPLRSGRI